MLLYLSECEKNEHTTDYEGLHHIERGLPHGGFTGMSPASAAVSGLEGIEVFMDDVKNRTEVLFAAEHEKKACKPSHGRQREADSLFLLGLPTSFLTKHSFSQLGRAVRRVWPRCANITAT